MAREFKLFEIVSPPGGKVEYKIEGRAFTVNGNLVHLYDPIVWDQVPFLTEDFCAEAFEVDRDEYRAYMSSREALALEMQK